MQGMEKILKNLSGTQAQLSSEEYLRIRCDNYNSVVGKLTGYDCDKCKNRGLVNVIDGDDIISRPCSCMKIRKTMKRIKDSGLEDALAVCTFDKFITEEPWQKNIKAKAMGFLKNAQEQWFFIGGQVGCGKTHICTAIVGQMLKAERAAVYMLWSDESKSLKASINDGQAYTDRINKLKSAEVLYIDDFFKTGKDDYGNNKKPTPGDVNLAFEIINYRYNTRGLTTIISSEHTLDGILDIDEATGSRINQKSRGYMIDIAKDRTKNYRLR